MLRAAGGPGGQCKGDRTAREAESLFRNTVAALTCKVLWGPHGTWALTGACFGALRPGLPPVRAAGAAVQSEASSQAAKNVDPRSEHTWLCKSTSV